MQEKPKPPVQPEPAPAASPEPKPIPGHDPAALSELARAMAANAEPEPEAPQLGSDGKPIPPKPVAASKEGAPPASQEPPKVKEGEPKPGDEQESAEEFLKGLDFNKPDEALKALLGHPTFGGKLQSWSDGGVAAQVQAARQRDRPAIEASERERAQVEADDAHFAPMSEDEVATEISQNPRAAAAYARYQARKEQGAEVSPDGVVAGSTIFAVTAQIASTSRLLGESDLPAEKKAELAGKNFTQYGPDGTLMWQEAVTLALVEQTAEARAQVLLGERWEAYQEERLAETDPKRPPLPRGSPTPPVRDVLEGDAAERLEEALSHQDNS